MNPFSAIVSRRPTEYPRLPDIDGVVIGSFPGDDAVHSAVFAPDGHTLYVLSHVPSVNIWAVAVSHWPEILGAVAGLILLVLLILFVRILRRPRQPGKPYCRRCNYDLSPQVRVTTDARPPFAWDPGTRCPECGSGLDAKRPIAGRSRFRRLAPTIAAAAFVAGAYASMHAVGLPRVGPASTWFDWSSRWLAERAATSPYRHLRLTPQPSDRIVAIDLRSDRTPRHVATRSSTTYFQPTVSPDGRTIFVGTGDTAIQGLDTRTGRRTALTRLPGHPGIMLKEQAVIGFSTDGTTAYVQWIQVSDNQGSGVSAWRWSSDRHAAILHQREAFTDDSRGTQFKWSRPFLFRDHAAPAGRPRFISHTPFMEAMATRRFEVVLYEPDAEPKTVQVRPTPSPEPNARMSPDGRTLWVAAGSGFELLSIDLDHGGKTTSTRLASPDAHNLEVSPDGRHVMYGLSKALFVRDVDKGKPIARLKIPNDLYAPTIHICPSGRWVAAVCQGGGRGQAPGGGRTGFTHQVVVWDLKDHPLSSAPPPHEPEEPSPTPTPKPASEPEPDSPQP